MASPPWNDRFRHWPLPLLDEVRFAKNVAWVLTPAVPSGLPSPDELDAGAAAAGRALAARRTPARAVVFHAFVPPFAPEVEPLAGRGRGGGRRPAHASSSPTRPRRSSCACRRRAPLAGVTLLAALDGPRLPRSADVQVSADGVAFETVATRRRREERLDLRWVNGHPQAVIDHDVIAIPLGGRAVVALRVVPLESAERWRVGEVLLHAERRAARPGTSGCRPALDWEARRRALVERPLPGPRGLVLARAARRAPPPAAVAAMLAGRRPRERSGRASRVAGAWQQ